jgi:peptidyl-prolyl cis-trans isomerase D
MLDALRRGAAGWLAKILFAVLVVSFAIWGIPQDFMGSGGNYVAKVGPTTISQPEYQRAFNDAVRMQQGETGQRFSTEDARRMGLDREVLNRLVAQASVKVHGEELKLALPEQALVDDLRRDENFKGRDGAFSKARFEAFLEQANISEQRFFQIRNEEEVRDQIVRALTDSVVVPPALLQMQNAYREETRVIEHATVNPQKVPAPAEPDEAKLKETFDRNPTRFVTPETRKVGALLLSIDDLKKGIEIPEADLKTAYEATKQDYEELEKRRVAQITFKDKAAADEAHKAITGGKDFMQYAKDAGFKETDLDLGLKTKAELIDAKVADAAFALKKDEVSAVIDGTFAPVLLKVTEIIPGKQSTFEEVKDKVRDKLAAEKAAQLIQENSDHVEEARNAGKTLSDIAKELKLTYVEGDADRNNKTADGKEALATPFAAPILEAAFALQPGAETAAVELPEGKGYAWPNLMSVTPAKPKAFDAVKDQVKALYLEQESLNALSKLAAGLVDRLSKGEDLTAVAADAGGTAETTLPITRSTSPQGLPRSAVAQAFSLPAGQAGAAETADRKSRVVFRVKEIKPAPEPSKEQTDKLKGELAEDLRNDMLSSYVAALEGKLKPQVNEKEFRRITGADTGQQ